MIGFLLDPQPALLILLTGPVWSEAEGAMSLRSEIRANEIRRLYVDEDWTMAGLAEWYHLSETTVHRRLHGLSIPPRPRGPHGSHLPPNPDFEWAPKLAYAVGLIATDGNLSKDGRHLVRTSEDKALLETARDCPGLENSITAHGSTTHPTCLLSSASMPKPSLL
jgi:hypothetical protein